MSRIHSKIAWDRIKSKFIVKNYLVFYKEEGKCKEIYLAERFHSVIYIYTENNMPPEVYLNSVLKAFDRFAGFVMMRMARSILA